MDNREIGGLRAGFSRLDITPPLGIPIAGYFIPRYAEGVLDPLEIRALAVKCGGETSVLVSIDNCGSAPARAFEGCRQRAAKAAGVPADSVFIACTHTHTGPFWGKGDDPSVADYTAFLEKRVGDAAKMAVEDMKPARMGCGVGRAPEVV